MFSTPEPVAKRWVGNTPAARPNSAAWVTPMPSAAMNSPGRNAPA
jgi:hypothetical protein